MKTIKIRPIVEGNIRGEVLVSPTNISFLGGIDPKNGMIIDPENPLYGQTIKDRIFVFPEGRGSTVGSYIIYSLSVNKCAPLALVANYAETIVIAGAILADIPLVDQPEKNILDMVKSGDIIEVDTAKEIIRIFQFK